MTENTTPVPENAEQIARAAYAGFAVGDLAAVLELVSEDLEWTFLDPTDANPDPAMCHGRDQLAYWMGRGSAWKFPADLVEVVTEDERVLVVSRSRGIHGVLAYKTGDLNFHVLTIRAGKIAALRACRNRFEALGLLGATLPSVGCSSPIRTAPRTRSRAWCDGEGTDRDQSPTGCRAGFR